MRLPAVLHVYYRTSTRQGSKRRQSTSTWELIVSQGLRNYRVGGNLRGSGSASKNHTKNLQVANKFTVKLAGHTTHQVEPLLRSED